MADCSGVHAIPRGVIGSPRDFESRRSGSKPGGGARQNPQVRVLTWAFLYFAPTRTRVAWPERRAHPDLVAGRGAWMSDSRCVGRVGRVSPPVLVSRG